MSDSLFDLAGVKQKSPRLMQLEEHDVQTHYSEIMKLDPYMAIPMKAARDYLKKYNPHDEPLTSVGAITASYGRVLDDAGLVFTGDDKKDVEDQALCRSVEYFRKGAK